jgi:NAD dependent epimerase/dehydratase family enzyme
MRVVHLRFGVVLGPGQGALAKIRPIFRLSLGGRLAPAANG